MHGLTLRHNLRSTALRLLAGSALPALAVLATPAVTLGAPTVTLKAKIVPILQNLSKRSGPTWPHTGNILGAPAALEGTILIKGSEYPSASEGFASGTKLNVGPPPLRRVDVYLPKGTRINAKGFKTCPESTFKNHLEPPCPKGSLASPPGEANGKVFFGGTEVQEKVLVQAYFAPGGKLIFWIEGRSPATIEEFAGGMIQSISGLFSKKLVSNVPLISTVPGAPYAIAEQIRVTVGAALKRGRKLISYGMVPKTCPSSGRFSGKAELWFGAGSESSWQEVTATTTVPCPKGAHRAGKHKARRRHHHHHHHHHGR